MPTELQLQAVSNFLEKQQKDPDAALFISQPQAPVPRTLTPRTEFRQAPELTFFQRLRGKIPRGLKEGLFGRVDEFYAATGRLPETIQEHLATQGLIRDNIILPFITRSQTVSSKLMEERFIKDGLDPNRAYVVAQTYTGMKAALPITRGMKIDEVEKRLGLSEKEREIIEKSVKIRELAEGAGILMDIPIFAGPISKAFRALKPTLINNLAGAKTLDSVKYFLREAGVPESIITKEAPKLVKLTKTDDVAKVVNRIENTMIGEAVTPGKVAPAARTAGRERGFLTSVKEIYPQTKIAGQYIPRGTDELSIRAQVLIAKDITEATRVATTGTDDFAVATASELINHYGRLAAKAKTSAEATRYYDKMSDVAHAIAPPLTSAGQTVQAASILGRMTPQGQVYFAVKEVERFNAAVRAARKEGRTVFGVDKEIPKPTREQLRIIFRQAEKVQAMPDGSAAKGIEFIKLQKKIAELTPSPLYNKMITVWKAGLLTGIKTSGLNTLSNLSHGVSEVVKDVPAAAVDNVAAIFTGERTLAFTVKGLWPGAEEGFTKGLRFLKTGFDERDVLTKLDYKKVNFGTSKVARGIQEYEEAVFRWLGAQDQPFYYGAKTRSMYSQAIAQAKNKGLKGKELDKFVDDLVTNPTDEMIRRATNDAEVAVFSNKTALGNIARAIQRIPGGEIVVPFGRTPASVATQIINYSPIGAARPIVRIIQGIRRGFFDQRLFAQEAGRAITGTAAMYIGMEAYKAGLISLDRPTDERELRQWELEGRKENSFKTPDGKWRSIIILGPMGITVIFGGQFQKALDETGSPVESMGIASFAALKSFREQTFLTGVNQFTTAINDPDRYGHALSARLFGSTVPTLVGDIARATDPLERRASPFREGFFAPMFARIPGVRRTLEPRIDAMGSPIARMGNAMETMIDPTRPTRIKSNELIDELRRLFDAGMPATPTRFADDRAAAEVLTQEQRTWLMERAGMILEEKLTNLIADPKYQKAPDELKMETIKQFTNRARLIAKVEMLNELVQDLEGRFTGEVDSEFGRKISELKKSGWLTEQMFNEWQEYFNSRNRFR